MSGYIFSELCLEAFTLVASLFSGRKRVAKQGEPGHVIVSVPVRWKFGLFQNNKFCLAI